MKQLLIIALTFTCLNAKAQFTDSTLIKMNKMQLTSIYLEQINQLGYAMPYAAFILDRTGVNDLDMPSSTYLNKKRFSVSGISTKYGSIIIDELNEVIAYADKSELVKGILFLQDINRRLQITDSIKLPVK